MHRGTAMRGAGQPVRHMAGVDADAGQPIPIQLPVGPDDVHAGRPPMVHARAVGVEEDHIAGPAILRGGDGQGQRGGQRKA